MTGSLCCSHEIITELLTGCTPASTKRKVKKKESVLPESSLKNSLLGSPPPISNSGLYYFLNQFLFYFWLRWVFAAACAVL